MDHTTAMLIVLGVFALLVCSFFAVFRRKGKFSIKTKLGEVTAEGENAPLNVAPENKSQILEPSTLKPTGGATEIGQVSSGANVFVAQPGGQIIVQSGSRTIPVNTPEEQTNTASAKKAITTSTDRQQSSSLQVRLGRFSEAENYLNRFEITVSGATARHVAVCEMRTYLFWMQGKHDLAKEWGKRGVELKSTSELDTRHDCSHNLALARRDSGEVEEALSYFLEGVNLKEVANPVQIFSTRSGAFYGNIGRCLFFKGDYESAQICLVKSASLLEKERHELAMMNQGWAAFWLGELFEKRKDTKMALICYKRAASRWKPVSPPRSEQATDFALRVSNQEPPLSQMQDWEFERAYLDWLKRVGAFTLTA